MKHSLQYKEYTKNFENGLDLITYYHNFFQDLSENKKGLRQIQVVCLH